MATVWRGPFHWDSGGMVWWAGSLGLASSLKLTPGARPSSLLLSSGGKLPGTGDRRPVWTILVCVDTTQAHKASCLSQPLSRRGENNQCGSHTHHDMAWQHTRKARFSQRSACPGAGLHARPLAAFSLRAGSCPLTRQAMLHTLRIEFWPRRGNTSRTSGRMNQRLTSTAGGPCPRATGRARGTSVQIRKGAPSPGQADAASTVPCSRPRPPGNLPSCTSQRPAEDLQEPEPAQM